MKCPHCNKQGKALVTETRVTDGDVYRRRSCGHCGKFFVTLETAPPNLVMPKEHNCRTRTTRAIRSKQIRGTGAHLQEYL